MKFVPRWRDVHGDGPDDLGSQWGRIPSYNDERVIVTLTAFLPFFYG